jgi:hypothetical protein
VQIGYLTAERAPYIGRMLDRGRELIGIFQELGTRSAVIRVAFDGAIPALPSPQDTAEAPADFWPDEEYPDT